MNEESPTPLLEPARKIRLVPMLMLVLAVGTIALFAWRLDDVNAVQPVRGEIAPDMTLRFFDGYAWESATEATLSEMRGQIIVVNFWASWCVECKLEADLLENSWRRYADNGVVFLGVAYSDIERDSYAYLETFNVTYPNAPDLGTRISNDYNITGVPETFVVGRDGVIAFSKIGPISESELNFWLESLLTEDVG